MKSFSKRKRLLAVATLAIAAIAVLVLLASSSGGADAPLKVDVFAKQYLWSFGYPDEGDAFVEREMHLPLGRPIEFEMHSADVLHAFWISEWDMKENVEPSTTTTVTFTPDKAGAYQLICTQACGILHSNMRAKVVVEPESTYEEWVDSLHQTVPAELKELIRLDNELTAIHQDTESG